MIRIGAAQLRYQGGDRSVGRTAAISRAALTLVAHRAQRSTTGYIPRLAIEVRVPHGASDATVAQRIAAALIRRL